MPISRNSGPASNTGGNGGGQNQTITKTTGPRTDTSITT